MGNIARRVIEAADRNMTNAQKIGYDKRREFVVDFGYLVSLYAGDPREECSYTVAAHAPEFKGQVCSISGIC